MLVLSRKEKESIQIDGNVTVTILGIKENKVLIGIEAPGNVSVHRLEVVEKIKGGK